MINMSNNNLFIVTAPSGSGKSSLIKALLNDNESITFSISYTTRKPRFGEKNGIDYHFVSVEDFLKMRNNNEFIEWAKVHSNFYGTHKSVINNKTIKDTDFIIEIDCQGSDQIKNCYPNAIRIFILPPSIEELRNRLILRNLDSMEVIEKRLSEAKNEIMRSSDYDYVIINSDFNLARSDMNHIIKSTKLRFQYQYFKNKNLFNKLGITN
ncbi:guanylate kinase [Candidatus Kinetoplastibacterium blastocrithidii TCC012E]|uniref:Guanylate kinase n=3 Tax=cellular organisms TaxID=131567 RepID=S9UIF6_9TRYP|nr:guanylate kinase [Candidatus Kinetoplastibacterium blastocrithidii]AFZ83592.1 guanylate kinase [Candidatus Kinetoplastibacterium blastocrithidii (ex Strigomonas culicis)]AGF49711.1 guanylate kinase [Candidatus Kinetoplastibacterium blastocrithidii TCC012E]EPY28116.1 guanylate kinase [Strigomonas culicis]EPY28519.1 guanylate kinase [Strigomonas culicis]|eukprot:EPY28116.1 guanylate kinase [Strigomonas culicis]